MRVGLSQRLLSILQLTRMALVFTAIADSAAALLIWARWDAESSDYLENVAPGLVLALTAISASLYGYGMSLNDIIDRRRDRQIAAYRPLPSGRIGVRAAHVICAMFFLSAVAGGVWLSRWEHTGSFSFVLLLFTAGLITFYDLAGKYLVAPGLLTLGLIRFFHATIVAPQLPLLLHPLLLMNHVTVLSTACYHLEAKRPPLTRLHWWAVLGGLVIADATCIGIVWYFRHQRVGADFVQALSINRGLLFPAAAVLLFVIVAIIIRRRNRDPRSAGQQLMLAGLLWLIVYDSAFVAGYVGYVPAVALLLMLPLAYLCVQFMRWWAKIVLLTQKPEYQRAR